MSAKTMAEVIRTELPFEITGEFDATAVWATPEEIAAALTAAGFGDVREAGAKALEDAADVLEAGIDSYVGDPYEQSLVDGIASIRARAAAVRGEG